MATPVGQAAEVEFVGELDYPEVGDDAESLIADGLLGGDQSLAGFTGAYITPAGRQFLARVNQLRSQTVDRRNEARLAFMRWLDGLQDPFQIQGVGNFKSSPLNSYYGVAFTGDDVQNAIRWLVGNGYVINKRARSDGTVLLVRLSAGGRTWVENDGRPSFIAQPAVSVAGNTFINSQTQIAGDGATQTMTVTPELLSAINEAVKGIHEARGALDLASDQAAVLDASLADLHEEAGSNEPKWERLFDRAQKVANSLRDVGTFAALLARGLLAAFGS